MHPCNSPSVCHINAMSCASFFQCCSDWWLAIFHATAVNVAFLHGAAAALLPFFQRSATGRRRGAGSPPESGRGSAFALPSLRSARRKTIEAGERSGLKFRHRLYQPAMQ